MNLYPLFWHIAKKIDPEKIHHFSLHLLHAFSALANLWEPLGERPARGKHFTWRNSLGLAAGLDKNALALNFWNQLGLGCIEVGTVTPLPQFGNDLPRIFRHDNANLQNAMGFPNDGSNKIYQRLLHFKTYQRSHLPIWINLGKQKDTPLLTAYKDYEFLIQKFASVADALVINISSPNTPELRQLQSKEYLETLLHKLNTKRKSVAPSCPLLLKVSPDEELDFYNQLPLLIKNYQWQGIIATNTTSIHPYGKGGVSGAYLFEKSFSVAKILSPLCRQLDLDFVYVGGLSQRNQYEELKKIGVQFFQIYTSFIYQGPAILKKIMPI